MVQIQDITDRKTAEGGLWRYAAQLVALSEKDPLTGLLNQRAFEAALGEELRIFQAGGESCSVLLIDVSDDDDMVAAIADTVISASRNEDQLAHLGQGRLAILLPKVSESQTTVIAQRIRGALSSPETARSSWAAAHLVDTVASLLQRASDALDTDEHDSLLRHDARAPAGIGRLLELARRQLGMPIAYLTRLDDESSVFHYLVGDHERLGVAEGNRMALSATLCQRMLDGRTGFTVTDLTAEPETQELDPTTQWGLRAYAGVPVRLRSGEIYGTLCTVDTQPHAELGERHVELLRFLSQLAGELIEADAEQHAARHAQATASGVRTLLVALEARDLYTGEHSKEVVTLDPSQPSART